MSVFHIFKIVQMVPNCAKHCIDIWQGPNSFELVDVSYYKEV